MGSVAGDMWNGMVVTRNTRRMVGLGRVMEKQSLNVLPFAQGKALGAHPKMHTLMHVHMYIRTARAVSYYT